MVWHRFCLSVATRNSGYKSPEVAEECNRNYYSEDLWAICERLSAFLEECATNFEYRTRVACQARKRCIAHRQRAYPNTHEFVPKKKKTKQFECIQIYRSWFIACFAHHFFGSVAHSHPPQSPNCANHIHFYLNLSFTSYFSRNLLHSLANTIYFTLCIKISFNVMSYLCKCRICADRTHKNICMTNIICFWFMCVEYNWGVLVLLLFRWNLSHIHNTWMVDATHI